jgi:hypothetical protein
MLSIKARRCPMGKHIPDPDPDRAFHVIAELMARPNRRDGRRVIGTESAAEIREALRSTGYMITAVPIASVSSRLTYRDLSGREILSRG